MVPTWLVTGANSGIGLTVSQEVLSRGYNLIAAVRNPSTLSDLTAKYPNNLLVAKCDVTKDADVKAAFEIARTQFGRIDVVWNNAGYSLMGEVEAHPIEVAKAEFETNVWGAVRVSKEAVRFFREVNSPQGGRLLQASSLMGIIAEAGSGYYSASKWALEALSESLSKEVDPAWNIKVTLIQLGQFRTNFGQAAQFNQHPAYASNPELPSTKLIGFLSNMKPEMNRGNPAKLAAKLIDFSTIDNPPRRLMLGAGVYEGATKKYQIDAEEREKYTSWSENITFDE